MRRLGQIFLYACINLLAAPAQQQYPAEWGKYVTEGYLYDVQAGYNAEGKSEARFKEYLAGVARTNLARQIEVRVEDVAKTDKFSSDGRTSIQYAASTRFSTDVELKLVRMQTFYDPHTGQGAAIAYIDKEEARNYYENEILLLCRRFESAMQLADRYVSEGHKPEARSELESVAPDMAAADDCLLWLNILGMQRNALISLQNYVTDKKQALKNAITGLTHGITVYLACTSDIFGSSYTALQDKVKGVLSESGCSFAASPDSADYVVTLRCSSRKYNAVPFGKGYSYVSYADASISIENTIASRRIYENAVSAKGVHMAGYAEAARVAYDKIARLLGEEILKNMER